MGEAYNPDRHARQLARRQQRAQERAAQQKHALQAAKAPADQDG